MYFVMGGELDYWRSALQEPTAIGAGEAGGANGSGRVGRLFFGVGSKGSQKEERIYVFVGTPKRRHAQVVFLLRA